VTLRNNAQNQHQQQNLQRPRDDPNNRAARERRESAVHQQHINYQLLTGNEFHMGGLSDDVTEEQAALAANEMLDYGDAVDMSRGRRSSETDSDLRRSASLQNLFENMPNHSTPSERPEDSMVPRENGEQIY
jgi:hypothetical protein